jgi:hypothetical protein
MHIPSKHVYDVLTDKGLNDLHHANSVATACQFLKSGSLMSRGTVERSGFLQTPQDSDDIDVRYSVWFDVFVDSVDIHKRATKKNVYGPVLFVIDIEIISKTTTGRIWLTKLNPTKWAGKSETQRWFQNKKDIEEEFVVGRFDQMLVFRHCGGELPFKKYLKKIILDDPEYQDSKGVDYYSMAYGALRNSMTEKGIDIPIIRRKCSSSCPCKTQYADDVEKLKSMFDPFIED